MDYDQARGALAALLANPPAPPAELVALERDYQAQFGNMLGDITDPLEAMIVGYTQGVTNALLLVNAVGPVAVPLMQGVAPEYKSVTHLAGVARNTSILAYLQTRWLCDHADLERGLG